jgi:GntR family transcriptional regulator/MocR family aminotransferase
MEALHRRAESYPPLLDQAVLADFMEAGHFERHLRRMRAAYRERLDALADAVKRRGRGALRLRRPRTGLHAVADLIGADATRVFREAAARGVEVMPLSAYSFGRTRPENALVLGFGAVRPESIDEGMARLVSAIEAARRPAAQR